MHDYHLSHLELEWLMHVKRLDRLGFVWIGWIRGLVERPMVGYGVVNSVCAGVGQRTCSALPRRCVDDGEELARWWCCD